MFPTVGRIVHYYDESGRGPMAAIIADTCDNADVAKATNGHKHTCDERCVHVTLAVFDITPSRTADSGYHFDVPFSYHVAPPVARSGHWTWPPRET